MLGNKVKVLQVYVSLTNNDGWAGINRDANNGIQGRSSHLFDGYAYFLLVLLEAFFLDEYIF